MTTGYVAILVFALVVAVVALALEIVSYYRRKG
jgi:hypothetical protein